MSDDDDITRNFHRGNPQSTAANRRTRKTQDRTRVYTYVHTCGRQGTTCYEAEQVLNMRHQTCSARFADLKRDGAIVGVGRTRPTDTGTPAEVCVAVVLLPREPPLFGQAQPFASFRA